MTIGPTSIRHFNASDADELLKKAESRTLPKQTSVDDIIKTIVDRFDKQQSTIAGEIALNPEESAAWQSIAARIKKLSPSSGERIGILFDHVQGDSTRITAACKKFRVSISEYNRLVDKFGGSVNSSSEDSSPLLEAVQSGNLNMIRVLSELGANLNNAINFKTPLILAISNNQLEVIKCLIECGADVNLTIADSQGITSTPVEFALRVNTSGIVTFLLQFGATLSLSTIDSIDQFDVEKISLQLQEIKSLTRDNAPKANKLVYQAFCALAGYTGKIALSLAHEPAQKAAWDSIANCIKQFSLPNYLQYKKYLENMLNESLKIKNLCEKFGVSFSKFYDFMIPFNGHVNGPSKAGTTPLFQAIQNEDIGMINILCQLGANVNELRENKTPLISAIGKTPALLKCLINNGANVNFFVNNTTPCREAVRSKDAAAVKLLSEHGATTQHLSYAQVNDFLLLGGVIKATVGKITAKKVLDLLQKAATTGLQKVKLESLLDNLETSLKKQNLKFILEFGAQAKDKEWKIVLDYIRLLAPERSETIALYLGKIHESYLQIKKGGVNVDELSQFLEAFHGSIIDARQDGTTPIIAAIKAGNSKLVQDLRALGVPIDLSNPKFLIDAAQSGKLEMVKYIYERCGIDINNLVAQGQSPLQAAIASNSIDIVKYLIEEGASISTWSTSGIAKDAYPPLSWAIAHNHSEIFKFLIDRGALINDSSSTNFSPLLFAYMKNNKEMAKELESRGADMVFAKECFAQKLLAHIWGLDGHSLIQDQKGNPHLVSLNGLHPESAMTTLSQLLKNFFREFSIDALSDQSKQEIIEAIKNVYPVDTPADAFQPINSKKPIILSAGWTAHSLEIVLYQNKLSVCNRGAGMEKDAVEMFELPAEQATPELLAKLSKKYDYPANFKNMFKLLNLKKIGGYRHQPQKMGNCSWASAKAALGVLLKQYTNDQIGHKIYKAFTEYTRLASYLLNLKRSSAVQDKSLLHLLHRAERRRKSKNISPESVKEKVESINKQETITSAAPFSLKRELKKEVSSEGSSPASDLPPGRDISSLKRELKREVSAEDSLVLSDSSSSRAGLSSSAPLILTKDDEETLKNGAEWIKIRHKKINHEVDPVLFKNLLKLSIKGNPAALDLLKTIGSRNMYVSECLGFFYLYGAKNFIEESYPKGWDKIEGLKPHEIRVEPNAAEAARWFNKAGRLGHVDAWERLGNFYLHGIHGFKQDKLAAFNFLKLAYEGYQKNPPTSTPLPEYAKHNVNYSRQTANALPQLIKNYFNIDPKDFVESIF